MTPRKAPGQPPKLSEEDIKYIMAFISSSKQIGACLFINSVGNLIYLSDQPSLLVR
jgi:hypothetical protein